MNERNIAAASYILEFYKNVQILTTTYVNYRELYRRFEKKLTSEKPIPPNEAEKEIYTATLQNIRYYFRITFLNYRALSLVSPLPEKEHKEIEELYNLFDSGNAETVDLVTVDRFVFLVNQYVVSDTLANLIRSSSDFLNDILENKNATPQ